MTTAIYILWGLVPFFFFCIWCVSTMERSFGKKKSENPADFLRSFLFTLGCFAAFVFLDFFVLDWLSELIGEDMFPRNGLLFLSFPILLMIGAQLVGGTKAIRITRAPGKR